MGGKSSPPPPDYSGMERVANRQLDFSERQYEEMKPTLTGLANTMRDAQEQQMTQAQDYFQYQQDTFRPLERGLVADAENFSTAGYREGLARDASAAAGRAFSNTEASNSRSLASMGINPNSGRALAMRNASNLGLSAQRAGAMTSARTQAEGMGFARRVDAAGLGRNLATNSTAAYQGATQAGTSAGNMYQAPGNQYQAGLSNAGSTYGNMANTQAGVYNAGMNASGEFYGALIGAGATAYASDARLKKNITQVGLYESLGLPMYEFEYIGGDGRVFRGVMAQDVEIKYPDAVITKDDGYKAVNYSMLGIEMMEV